MGLFKKNSKLNIFTEASEKAAYDIDVLLKAGQSIESVSRMLRRKYILQLIVVCSVTAVLAAASVAFISQAWFAKNDEVSASNSTISVDPGPSALFIEAGNIITGIADYQDSYQYNISVLTDAFSGGLYPISASSRGSWYCADTWSGDNVITYKKVSPSRSTTAGQTDRWRYTLNGKTYVAYNKATYTLYTNLDGEMNVYLASGTGIDVHVNDADGQALLDSLRVAITYTTPGSTESKFIVQYAPSSESGSGNSAGSASETYYRVASTTAITTNSAVKSNYSTYSAYKNSSGKYTAVSKKICTTDYDGMLINVYIWLEGTDAQAVLGSSDIAGSISVNLNFVGIPVE